MASDNAAWLDLTQEETLEPDLPIIDPHHHLWDARGSHYVQQRYLLEDMLADVNSGHNITQTVFIECGAMFRGRSAKCGQIGGSPLVSAVL